MFGLIGFWRFHLGGLGGLVGFCGELFWLDVMNFGVGLGVRFGFLGGWLGLILFGRLICWFC